MTTTILYNFIFKTRRAQRVLSYLVVFLFGSINSHGHASIDKSVNFNLKTKQSDSHVRTYSPLNYYTKQLPESPQNEGIPVYYWREPNWTNFGDFLSVKMVERMTGQNIQIYSKKSNAGQRKLLAIGSILYFAADNDVVWGSGINGKTLKKSDYSFKTLDVRAIRGPLSKHFLQKTMNIDCPDVYGDPALLFPYIFPEFKKKENPTYPYIIIPHYSEMKFFPKIKYPNVVYPTEPWDVVIEKILDSKFVISSSLHGIIIAEAYGIPARLLRITENEKIFKYLDYYLGTGRYEFRYATSIEEALMLGGEKPFSCDLESLYNSFPFELWPNTTPKELKFNKKNS